MTSDKIVVQLPNKIEVDAPQTDKRIDAQIQAFTSLSKMLQKAFTEIAEALQTLRVLPNLVQGFQKQVNKEFQNLFRHQLEGQVHARNATRSARETKRDAMVGIREEKVKELPADRERIGKRYAVTLEQAAAQCDKQIRSLDSHAFRITEEVFPQQIQERFSYDSVGAFEFLAAHADESAAMRALCLGEGFAACHEAAGELLGARKGFYEDLKAAAVTGALQPGWHVLPVLVIETEDCASGSRGYEVVLAEGKVPVPVAEATQARIAERVQQALGATRRVAMPPELHGRMEQVLAAVPGVSEGEVARFRREPLEVLVVGPEGGV